MGTKPKTLASKNHRPMTTIISATRAQPVDRKEAALRPAPALKCPTAWISAIPRTQGFGRWSMIQTLRTVSDRTPSLQSSSEMHSANAAKTLRQQPMRTSRFFSDRNQNLEARCSHCRFQGCLPAQRRVLAKHLRRRALWYGIRHNHARRAHGVWDSTRTLCRDGCALRSL